VLGQNHARYRDVAKKQPEGAEACELPNAHGSSSVLMPMTW
jgi:hypothetical protein